MLIAEPVVDSAEKANGIVRPCDIESLGVMRDLYYDSPQQLRCERHFVFV